MTRRLASAAYLLVSAMIGFGAYGHGFVGRLHIDRELDRFPIAPDVYTMLYVVWYFVSGCMLLFGIALIWSWFRWRRGEPNALWASWLIGVLYAATGVGGMIYRHGDPFMGFFVMLGVVVLASTAVLARRPAMRA